MCENSSAVLLNAVWDQPARSAILSTGATSKREVPRQKQVNIHDGKQNEPH